MVVRGARLGIAALLAMVLASAVGSGQPLAAASRGDGWTRVDVRREIRCARRHRGDRDGGPGFVAVGRRDIRDPAALRPGVWTSSDGAHWDGVDVRFRGGRFPGFRDLAASGGVLVTSSDGTELWRSTDVSTWQLVETVARSSRAGTGVTVGPRGFVAINSNTISDWSAAVGTSRDGRNWKWTTSTGTMARPVGLVPYGPLGSHSLSVGPSINNAPPMLYASKDGADWAPITGANVPQRFGRPLATNRRHTQVLGIEYEPLPGGVGGRLWSSPDATTWKEIASFHRQLPDANPRDLVQDGSSWVVGGTTGTSDGKLRDAMWSSPDLRHWDAMPAHLQGPEMFGGGVTLTAGKGRVVGLGSTERGPLLWVWTPPA